MCHLQGRMALGALLILVTGTAISAVDNVQFAGTSLTVTSLPAQSVAPSNSAGTKTFVSYKATLRSLDVEGSPATIYLALSTQPARPVSNFAVRFVDLPPNALEPIGPTCSVVGGSSVRCTFSKFDSNDSYEITFRAEAPTSPGTFKLLAYRSNQPLTNSGHPAGNHRIDTLSIPVTTTSGASFVPANTAVTVRTSPGMPTAGNPLIGVITSPKLPYDYTMYTGVRGFEGGTDFNATGLLGIFLSLTDGGPYLARKTADPTLAIEIDAETLLGQPIEVLPDNPFIIESISDVSIVSPLQLPPTFLTPEGTPRYAFFYNGLGGELRAEADACGYDDAPAPCVLSRSRAANGDWSIKYRKASTGTEGGTLALGLDDLLFGPPAFAQITPKIRTR